MGFSASSDLFATEDMIYMRCRSICLKYWTVNLYKHTTTAFLAIMALRHQRWLMIEPVLLSKPRNLFE